MQDTTLETYIYFVHSVDTLEKCMFVKTKIGQLSSYIFQFQHRLKYGLDRK